MKLAVIIPMAGAGRRFKDAGYEDYKPFIKVNGSFMVDMAIGPYPKEVKKYFIVCKEHLTGEQLDYLKNIENSEVVEIGRHENGPSYSIYQARNSFPEDYSYFIS